MSDTDRCVGFSSSATDDQCTIKVKYFVESSIFGKSSPFSTCGRHLAWAIRLRLRQPGGAVHEVRKA